MTREERIMEYQIKNWLIFDPIQPMILVDRSEEYIENDEFYLDILLSLDKSYDVITITLDKQNNAVLAKLAKMIPNAQHRLFGMLGVRFHTPHPSYYRLIEIKVKESLGRNLTLSLTDDLQLADKIGGGNNALKNIEPPLELIKKSTTKRTKKVI